MSLACRHIPFAALLAVHAASCSTQTKGGFKPTFDCGELDYFEVVSLMHHFRTYEVACGAPPEGDPYAELSWRELAAEARRLSEEHGICDGPEGSRAWAWLRRGCAIEATVNVLIHGHQATGCPQVAIEDGWPDLNYFAPDSYMSDQLGTAMDAECSAESEDGDPEDRIAVNHPPRTETGGSASQRGGRDPAYPFACGEVDLYDLAALFSGGTFEERCSDVAEGTWVEVAGYLREHVPCNYAELAMTDRAVACDVAACANSLVDSAARSTCDDFGPFVSEWSDECVRAWFTWYDHC
jgi:hypothetical protein